MANKGCIPWNKGKRTGHKPGNYVALDEILAGKHPNIKTTSIKTKLIESGLKLHQCEKCKNTMWNDLAIPLELEHINGNSTDHSIENLLLLCPNCHSQTDTYKGKNKGKGRHVRRIRYLEGKSY